MSQARKKILEFYIETNKFRRMIVHGSKKIERNTTEVKGR